MKEHVSNITNTTDDDDDDEKQAKTDKGLHICSPLTSVCIHPTTTGTQAHKNT